MTEAYLVNESDSLVNLPLFEKLEQEVNGRTYQTVVFYPFAPKTELVLGQNISKEKERFYQQFKPIDIYLKFRDVDGVAPAITADDLTNKGDDNPEPDGDDNPEPDGDDNPEPDGDGSPNPNGEGNGSEGTNENPDEEKGEDNPTQKLTREDLVKKTQKELIEIATGMGLEATTAMSKAAIAELILNH